jgi:hypothetical protein
LQDSITEIEETGSNLLPTMSKETISVVGDVVHRLFKTINNQINSNQNLGADKELPLKYKDVVIKKKPKNFIRSYTDFYDNTLKSENTMNLKKVSTFATLVINH